MDIIGVRFVFDIIFDLLVMIVARRKYNPACAVVPDIFRSNGFLPESAGANHCAQYAE
jgi:hypothetical protein